MEKENVAKAVVLSNGFIKWGLYVFAFLLPLFFMPFNSNIVELNKQLLLVVFSLLFLIAWVGKIIALGELRLKKSLLNLGILVFLISSLISAVLSKNIYASLVGSNGTIAEAFLTVLAMAIIFFVVVNNFKSKKEIHGFLFVAVLSGFIAGLFAVLQLTGKFLLPWDFAKAVNFNTIGSINSLEIFLASLLVLCAVLFTETETARWKQIFYGVAASLFLLMVLSINFSNVWWGLLLATMVIISLGIINREQVSQYRLILPMVILAFAVLMLLTKMSIFSAWLNTPTEISPSYSATLDIDKQVLKNSLFFGTGPGSFAYDYGLYRSSTLNQTDFWNVRFNQGISKIASQPSTLGIFGSLAWLILVVGFGIYGFLKLVRHRGTNWVLGLGIFSAWFLLAALQFFYTTNLTLEFAFWASLALAFLTIKTLKPSGEEEKRDDFSKIEAIEIDFDRTSPMASILSFVFVIVLVLTISVFYLGGSYYYADILYQRGLQAVSVKNDLDGGSNLIVRAVTLNSYNDLYLRNLSQAALLKVEQEFNKSQSAARDSNIQNLIATAVNIAKRSTDLSPLDIDNWEQLGIIYRAVMPYTAGADQWAFDSFKQASKLEPQNPFYFYELGRSYLVAAQMVAPNAQKDKDSQTKLDDYLSKAESAFNQAVSVKPDYSPALYQLSLVYDYEGKIDPAIEKMKTTRDLNSQDVGVAFQLGLLYYKKPNLDLARAEFERAILIDPNYSNALYFLGLVYDKQSDKAKALDMFNRVLKLNPDNQDIKTIIANIQAGKPAVAQPQQGLPIQEKTPQEQPPQPGL